MRERSPHHPGRIIFSPPSRQERQVLKKMENPSSLVFLGGLAVQILRLPADLLKP
jgi:hypothetical protein